MTLLLIKIKTMNGQKVLRELQSEIDETLMFICVTQMEVYGHLKRDIRECFETQGVKFPELLAEFIEN